MVKHTWILHRKNPAVQIGPVPGLWGRDGRRDGTVSEVTPESTIVDEAAKPESTIVDEVVKPESTIVDEAESAG